MKVSVNWLKKYVDIDLPIENLVQKIGAQLGAVEGVYDSGAKYKDIVVTKVVECASHPNADKLSVCKIDVGKKQLVQVVCGAPNVREGLLVAWIPPGAIVPSTHDKDPFVLEAKELRGVISHGMLASANELAISDDHQGILEVNKEAKPGSPFSKVYDLDDFTIDIENKMFTHRPDCFGILGVAREIAGITNQQFKSPDWYLGSKTTGEHKSDKDQLTIVNQLPKLTPRFMARVFNDIEVRSSPVWMQALLTRLNIKPINNIVDITNYYAHLTGQPLHAYDYDKVAAKSRSGAKIVVRYPRKGELLKLLNGKTIEPHAEAVCIATDKELIGLGGVMGGSETEVDAQTKNIILECANFDLYSIRRTSMIHGLFTEAVTRFSKGQSPNQCDRVLAAASDAIIHESSGLPGRSIYDEKTRLKDNPAINVSTEFINERLGLKLRPNEILKILKNVEFTAEATRGDVLIVKAPFWRTDIHIPEDIVEEVGRLYGYDHLPLELPRRTTDPARIDPELNIVQEIREKLSNLGANETLNYSFVHGNLFEATNQDSKIAFKISNALSPDLQYYRLSLMPSLLEKVHPNIKSGFDDLVLFEIGKVHSKIELDKGGLPKELGRVGLVVASKKGPSSAPYYNALAYLEPLLADRFGGLKLIKLRDSKIKGHAMFDAMMAPFEPERSAILFNYDAPLGIVGEYTASVRKKLKLPSSCSGFELFLSPFLKNPKFIKYTGLSRYPSTEQDITLKTKIDLNFDKLRDSLWDALKKITPQDIEFSLQCIGIYSSDKKFKNTTFRITFVSQERTLTDEIINKILDSASEDLSKKIGALRV